MPVKILVVDDEPNIVKMVASRLEANGYEVIKAYDGMECFEKAKAEQPQLIILDISMPRMNGHETLQKLKHDAATKEIPVIMLTGKAEADDVVKSVGNGGALDYIVKPFIASQFLKKVNTAYRGDQQVQEDTAEQEVLDVVEKTIKKVLNKKKEK
jgi:DNA-binding response OmpR family regulator